MDDADVAKLAVLGWMFFALAGAGIGLKISNTPVGIISGVVGLHVVAIIGIVAVVLFKRRHVKAEGERRAVARRDLERRIDQVALDERRASAERRDRRDPVTITARRYQVTVHKYGFLVRHAVPGAESRWTTHLDFSWSELRGLGVSSDGRDPTLALYAYPAEGRRQFVMDARHFNAAQWRRIAYAVHADSAGAVSLDLRQLQII